jgi:hypothetical protein
MTSGETVTRLEKANADLSTRALTLAEDAENQRAALAKRMQAEIQDVKRQMEEVQGEADEERTRGQTQRIQLLDEVSTLRQKRGMIEKYGADRYSLIRYRRKLVICGNNSGWLKGVHLSSRGFGIGTISNNLFSDHNLLVVSIWTEVWSID